MSSLSIPKLNLSIVNASEKEYTSKTLNSPLLPNTSSLSPTKGPILNKRKPHALSLSARNNKTSSIEIEALSIKKAISYNGEYKSKSARLRETFLDSTKESSFILRTPREERLSARPIDDLSPHIKDFHPDEFNVKDLQKFPESGWITRRSQENEGKMDASHKKLGDQYVFLMAKELNAQTIFLNLSDNRLSDAGIIQLTKCLPISAYKLQYLDLSENSILKKGAEELASYLLKSKDLLKLDLKKMEISDGVARTLARCLTTGEEICSLTSLNLSDNKIECPGAIGIANSLHKLKLKELSLSWNSIKHTGTIALTEALKGNNNLLSFDLSWNALGSKSDQFRTTAAAISSLLETNTTLTHLDLSQNQLKENDIIVIGEGLKKNHTLLGIHITGNSGKVDAYGQLEPDAEPWPIESAHSMTRIVGPMSKVQGRERWALRNSCWICSKWREHRFKIKLTQELIDVKKQNNGPLYFKLLTSFDKWMPDNMSMPNKETVDDNKADNIYSLYRMVPPGEHFYLFTLQDGPLFYDEMQPHVSIEDMINKTGLSLPSNMTFPSHVNTLYIEELSEQEKLNGFESLFTEPCSVQPRSRNPDLEVVAVKKAWSSDDGMFASQGRFHTDMYMKSILASDWKYMKCSKGKDLQLVAQYEKIFLKNARLLLEVYTHYSCVYTAEMYFISLGSFNEFIQKCKIQDVAEVKEDDSSRLKLKRPSFEKSASNVIAKDSVTMLTQDSGLGSEEGSIFSAEPSISMDGGSFVSINAAEQSMTALPLLNDASIVTKQSINSDNTTTTIRKESTSTSSNPTKKSAALAKGCTRTEIDMIFISNAIIGPKHELNGRRSLCRFQFFECLIGLAAAKFCSTGICKDKASALEKLIEDHIKPYAERDDSMKFRENILITEAIDSTLKACKENIEKVYKNYSGLENLPTEISKTVSIKEWINMCDDSMLSEVLGERPTRLAYCRSKIQSKDIFDEATNFKKMNYFEFCEAIVRVAFWIKGGNNAEIEERPKSKQPEQPTSLRRSINRSGDLIPIRQMSKASLESLSIVSAEEVAEEIPNIMKRFNYIKVIKK